jgi:uncharacterized glyoxalase superfamily protein PhnB
MTEAERPAVVPALVYRDNVEAMEWLERVFGFERHMVIEAGGEVVHIELRLGRGLVMVGRAWNARLKSPAELGFTTQAVHVHIDSDVDAHCARAREAGATIEMEPETQFYGDRTYRALDLDGHLWTFSQAVQTVSPEQWDADTGMRTTFTP